MRGLREKGYTYGYTPNRHTPHPALGNIGVPPLTTSLQNQVLVMRRRDAPTTVAKFTICARKVLSE